MSEPQGPPLVVLAAGLARRYGGLKQLEPVGPSGEAIMDYNIWDAIHAGFGRIVVVARPEIEEPILEHLRHVVGDAVPFSVCNQVPDLLPHGYRAPPDRRQPWGTGHAVLCAARTFDGPFGVCNADDLYGRRAFERLAGFLRTDPPPPEAALVGYTLSDTLSGSSRVSRGICVLGRGGFLESLTEIQDIRMVDGWITGVNVSGEVVELREQEVASMNLFGLTRPVVDLLRRQFVRFLESWGASTEAEFRISTAINGQIRIGATRCQVLVAEDRWFGMTDPDDREEAVREVASRVDQESYPPDLAEAFRETSGT
jgi:hypothetical protein